MGGGVEGHRRTLEDTTGAVFPVTSQGRPMVGEGSSHCYLFPCELRWQLPVQRIILVQAETFVDQIVLRGRGGRKGRTE